MPRLSPNTGLPLLLVATAMLAQNPPAMAQSSHESIVPASPNPGDTTFRSIIPLVSPVYAGPNHKYATASSPLIQGQIRPARFQRYNGFPSYTGVGTLVTPTGAGSWFDVQSMAEVPTTGNIAVAGIAKGGLAAGPDTGPIALLLKGDTLECIANMGPAPLAGFDSSLPTRVLTLPNGDIWHLMHGVNPNCGVIEPWVICYSQNLLGPTKFANTYRLPTCDASMVFNDWVYDAAAQRVYLVGHVSAGPPSTHPILMTIDATAANYGAPILPFIHFDHSYSTAPFSSMFAITIDPGTPTRILTAGIVWNFGFPSFINELRLWSYTPSTGQYWDVAYPVALVPRAGGLHWTPASGTLDPCGSHTPLLQVAGSTPSGHRARHARVDPLFPTSIWGSDFGGLTTPPYTAFTDMTPELVYSDRAILVGSRRETNAAGYHPYLVRTRCTGDTVCSQSWQTTGISIAGELIDDRPFALPIGGTCDASNCPAWTFSLLSRFLTCSNDSSVQQSNCYGFTGDISGDGSVDGLDIAFVLGDWGCLGLCTGDANEDGIVNGADLSIVLGNWGPVP